jgi:hypothetical protein
MWNEVKRYYNRNKKTLDAKRVALRKEVKKI